jgi:serine/threonine protein kinase
MVRVWVKNKELGIKRAPSAFIFFSQKVFRDGCEEKPRRRLTIKTYVKSRRIKRWRSMTEDERQPFFIQMSEGHKETLEKRTLLLGEDAVAEDNLAVAEDDNLAIAEEEQSASAAQASGPEYYHLVPGSFLGCWKIVRILGSGSYGQVVKVNGELCDMCLAAKVAVREDTLQDLDAERRILESLNHQHIVRAFGFISSRDVAGLLLELAQADLLSWLSKAPNELDATHSDGDASRSGGLRQRWAMLYQLVSAVGFVHDHRILHLDIKTNNVLVVESQSRTPVVKLADFGLSQRAPDDKLVVYATEVFTLNFRAPELLFAAASRVEISYPSDIYAVGCCAYDMFKVSCASPLLFPGKAIFKHLADVHASRGKMEAITLLEKYRDKRLSKNTARTFDRVQDAIAKEMIQGTVAPLARRASLSQLKARVHHRASDFEKQFSCQLGLDSFRAM